MSTLSFNKSLFFMKKINFISFKTFTGKFFLFIFVISKRGGDLFYYL